MEEELLQETEKETGGVPESVRVRVHTCGHSIRVGSPWTYEGAHWALWLPFRLALPAQDPVWLQQESVEEDPGMLTTCVQVSKKSFLLFFFCVVPLFSFHGGELLNPTRLVSRHPSTRTLALGRGQFRQQLHHLSQTFPRLLNVMFC